MRKQIAQLFTVAALTGCVPIASAEKPRRLASGAPACGNVLDKANGNKSDSDYKNCLAGYPDRPPPWPKVPRMLEPLLTVVKQNPAMRPRALVSGAPACGNVATRAGRSLRCKSVVAAKAD
jgi:hypothetical protein